jgi:hypothetical protein
LILINNYRKKWTIRQDESDLLNCFIARCVFCLICVKSVLKNSQNSLLLKPSMLILKHQNQVKQSTTYSPIKHLHNTLTDVRTVINHSHHYEAVLLRSYYKHYETHFNCLSHLKVKCFLLMIMYWNIDWDKVIVNEMYMKVSMMMMTIYMFSNFNSEMRK